MTSFERLIERLPSLYRPDEQDDNLLTQYFQAVAGALDTVNGEASAVMQAHSFRDSDQARYHPHFSLSREYRGQAPVRPFQAVDIVDVASLIQVLAEQTPLNQFLSASFPAELNQQISAFIAPATPALQRALVDALSRVVEGPPIYSDERFAAIALAPEVTDLLAAEPEGETLARLNRLLLEAAFPGLLGQPFVDHFYIHDLARLGSLLPLPPWQQPPYLRESVEAYRLRIQRMVALYRDGLGTLNALRRMVEAQLPIALDRPAEERDRPFLLEPFPPARGTTQAIQARGAPLDMLGPLMRWTLTNQGLSATCPTLFIQGVAPQGDRIDATEQPLIERYSQAGGARPLGIAYDGSLGPGDTLRLRPAYSSWIAMDGGPRRCRSLPAPDLPADPTAPGPWNIPDNTPDSKTVCFHQTVDRVLWLAQENLERGELVGHDGHGWTTVLADLPPIRCLAEEGHQLLIGSDDGLLRLPLFPEADFATEPVAGTEGLQVNCLLAGDGFWWLGTESGLFQLKAGDVLEPFVLHESAGAAVAVHALARDETGFVYLGTDRALFQYQPNTQSWYWYAGEAFSEHVPDWQPFTGTLPDASKIFLPPVRAILRGADSSLWLGTDQGIARYLARSFGGTAYQTLLEAFPDLCRQRVHAIRADARGQVWFCTERGLFRFDGRDFWQPRTTGWKQLGAAATLYQVPPQPRGAWRFAVDHWERFAAGGWRFEEPALRTTNRAPVYAIAWTDTVQADRGEWDGETFTPANDVSIDKLVMRYKPAEERIVAGGIPAVPRLEPGGSHWRYLRYLPLDASESEDLPSWTAEGRLLPPPDRGAPWPGRFDLPLPPSSLFDEAVFAFNPAARVWFAWEDNRALTVLVRLRTYDGGEIIDPAVIDRVWQGLQLVRPAGVRMLLAIEEQLLRGEDNGTIT